MPNRESSKHLVDQMKAGAVDTLMILGGNPVYDAPVDWGLGEALAKVKHAVHLSSHADETSLLCEWHLPEAHSLEIWVWDVRIRRVWCSDLRRGSALRRVTDYATFLVTAGWFVVFGRWWWKDRRSRRGGIASAPSGRLAMTEMAGALRRHARAERVPHSNAEVGSIRA